MTFLSDVKQAEIIEAFKSTSSYLDTFYILTILDLKAWSRAMTDFDMVNFPFLDGDVLRSASYGVYISHLIGFARVSNHGADFNAHNKSLTAKLLQQGYRYHNLRKTFSKFYRRHYELISNFNVGLKHFCRNAYRNRNFMVTVYKLKKKKKYCR